MRNQRRGLTLGVVLAALAAVLALPVAWYLLSPLFITRAVDEPLPGVAPTVTGAMDEMMEATLDATATPEPMVATNAAMMGSTEDASMAATLDAAMAVTAQAAAMQATQGMETAQAMPTAMVNEPMPTEMPAEPVVLASGSFYHVVHEGAGTATIYALPDGQRVLRLDDFTVLNGPDLHVYLVPIDPVPDQVGVDIDGALDLGTLKGNVGSQNYAIPADVDLTQFQSVVIWCQPFRVPFIAAALE